MWARLDTDLLDHRKILEAGTAIGKNGPAIALGFYSIGLLWSNKHLSDGHIPLTVVQSFRLHVADPAAVADALVKAGLWEKNGTGYVIHDYHEYGNPSAAEIAERRAKDRLRKGKGRA